MVAAGAVAMGVAVRGRVTDASVISCHRLNFFRLRFRLFAFAGLRFRHDERGVDANHTRRHVHVHKRMEPDQTRSIAATGDDCGEAAMEWIVQSSYDTKYGNQHGSDETN